MWAELLPIRADCPYQYKENKITCLSTIWQVIHMQFVDISFLLCVSVFMRTILQKMVIVAGTTMSNSYVTQIPVSSVHYYACPNLDAVQSALPNIETWSHYSWTVATCPGWDGICKWIYLYFPFFCWVHTFSTSLKTLTRFAPASFLISEELHCRSLASSAKSIGYRETSSNPVGVLPQKIEKSVAYFCYTDLCVLSCNRNLQIHLQEAQN